jgi:hypothetical protein
MHHGPDLTPGVQSGLAWFYLLVVLANLGFGLYLHLVAKRFRSALLWYLVGAGFLVLAGVSFAGLTPRLPHWIRDLSNQGIKRGLITLGVAPETGDLARTLVSAMLWLVVAVAAIDAVASFLAGFRETMNRLFFRSDAGKRLVAWSLIIAVLALLLNGTNAITYFILSVAAFAALFVWRRTLTEPAVAWGILNLSFLFGGLSMTDYDFREIIVKPDNVPIVFLVYVVGFFTWLALRRAVLNDERMAKGLPPLEKEEDEKVLVWPDLVYTELICMVVVTVVLVVWSVALPAPLEQPASSTKTPNPSKAPWYFLGLQEMLVYYDPWIAGVVLPTFIILGLMAIPYIDFNQKGNGYYTYEQRRFSIVTFLFGFVVLWVTLIFLGTFLRGPNWNFFGLYEPRSPYKLEPLNNVNLSDYFWVRGLGIIWEHPSGTVSFLTILARESPGIILILLYFLVLPPLLAKTIFRTFFIRMGFIRYFTMVMLLLFMASLPIKMVLRWAFNLKYIVAIPEYFFNI